MQPPSESHEPAAQTGPTTWVARAAGRIARPLFTTQAGPPPEARLAWLEADIDDYFRHAGAGPRRLFGLAAFVVIYLGPLVALRLPLGLVSMSAQIETLERIERGPLGVVFLFIKAILCLIYFEDPEAEASTGYHTPCLVTPSAASRPAGAAPLASPSGAP